MNVEAIKTLAGELRESGVVCVRTRSTPNRWRWRKPPSIGALHTQARLRTVTGAAKAPFTRISRIRRRRAAYRELLEKSNAADIAAALWGSDDVWFMYEQVFLKEGGENRRTPWHQDSLVTADRRIADRGDVDSRLTPSLRKIRSSSCAVRITARCTTARDSTRTTDTAPIYGDGSLPRLPNIEAERSRWDIVSWAVEPGDVIVFHPGVLQRGAAHSSRHMTAQCSSLRFFGVDARYALRPGMSGKRRQVDDPEASVFARAAAALSPGDPLRHPVFRNCVPHDDAAAHLHRSAAGEERRRRRNRKP